MNEGFDLELFMLISEKLTGGKVAKKKSCSDWLGIWATLE